MESNKFDKQIREKLQNLEAEYQAQGLGVDGTKAKRS